MQVRAYARAAPVRALTRFRMHAVMRRRASHLRTYAGDTVLPGGKWEPRDKSYEATAVGSVIFGLRGRPAGPTDSDLRPCRDERHTRR